MQRILVRVYRDPSQPVGPEELLARDLFGANNGNLLFSDAAVAAVSAPDTEVTCWTLNQMVELSAELNERFDHVILPFANAFRPGHIALLRTYTELVERLRIPVTILGIGAQSGLDYSMDPLRPVDEAASAFVRAALDRSPSIGVRGEFTARYLEDLGFTATEVIGCPSMFTHGPHLPQPRPAGQLDARSRIALNLTPGKGLPPMWIDRLLDRYPLTTYFPQSHSDLRRMLAGSGPAGPPADPDEFPNRLDHRLFVDAAADFHVDSETWIKEMSGFDFSVGTRIHGNIAALLAGTPAHVVVHDSRTRELAEYLGIAHTRLDRLDSEPDLTALAEQDTGTVFGEHPRRFAAYTGFLDRHGVRRAWRPGVEEDRSRVEDAQPRPRVVRIRRGLPDDVGTRVSWLENQHRLDSDTLRDDVARLRDDVDALRDDVADLRRQVQQLATFHHREEATRSRRRVPHLSRHVVARMRQGVSRRTQPA